MKSITEQLDDHFGVDGWFKVLDGDVELGDMCSFYSNPDIWATNSVGHSVAGVCDYYRAKPKPEKSSRDDARDAVDKAVVEAYWSHVDRMNDIAPEDPAERIIASFLVGVEPQMGVLHAETKADLGITIDPEQSEKFWIIGECGGDQSVNAVYNSLNEAKEAALERSFDGKSCYVYESVGIARAPKVVEYEEL